MRFDISFHGATRGVTGSLYVIRAGDSTVLLECGMFQGRRENERHNRDPFPVDPADIDAVVLSHAHIDHSGRIPLLVRNGYEGPIYTQHATRALCEIMLPDSGYLHERDAEWRNKRRNGSSPYITPLYTRLDAEECLTQFRGIDYNREVEVVPDLFVRLRDAGHILGAAIVELTYRHAGVSKTIVFSGDLGTQDGPVMRPPQTVTQADLVILESTYGDREHRPMPETLAELQEVIESAHRTGGNILIPSFAVGRTQDLLYLFTKYWDDWQLRNWKIYLDSPMAIEATRVYANHRDLYDARFFDVDSFRLKLPNFRMTRSTQESMQLNQVSSGAIIIAGSGMCNGGRIRHHLKNNIWRPECHVVIVGYQADGTLGRRLVDGAATVSMWGDEYAVRAKIHTIGGLSAHAGRTDLLNWYGAFHGNPPVSLVHGEDQAQQALAVALYDRYQVTADIAQYGQKTDLID